MASVLNNRASFILFWSLYSLMVSDLVSGQIRYSIPEELEQDAFIGNIAEDLGLDVHRLSARKLRMVSDDRKRYLEVNMPNGILFVNERIDREKLCGQSSTCFISFDVSVENPLEMYRVEVEILDINDNSPSFPKGRFTLQIFELVAPGTSFPLESAHDPDVGINTISTYQISPNEHFGLKIETRSDGAKTAELVLQKTLDREQQSTFQLALTAIDGGIPHRSGTAQVFITVLDANDNAPVFSEKIYRANLLENTPKDTLVIRIQADDLDERQNGEVTYSFSDRVSAKVRKLFNVDPVTGEVRVQGVLDYEVSNMYELDVQAVDNAPQAMALVGYAKVFVGIIDINDNAPDVKLTSLSGMVAEDAIPGTVIALITVSDRDSGKNGQVDCQLARNVPFKLLTSSKYRYKLVTSDTLDRETVALYNVSILAWDEGSPPLSTTKIISVTVSDVNDNAPQFTQSSYNVYLTENNSPGASIFTVEAVDRDLNQNGEVSYFVLESNWHNTSAYVSINSKSGNLYALRSFDYEKLKHFQIHIQARDGGVLSLNSIATLNAIILDQNDNAPVVVSPITWNNSANVEIAPQSTYPGYTVTKVIATDADSGQNARLSYKLMDCTDPSLFKLDPLTGEITTTRSIFDVDVAFQRVVLLVKDNGQPSLSTTLTILFQILDNVTEQFFERNEQPVTVEYFSHLNLYLIIGLGTTSLIFLVIITCLVTIKCKQDSTIIRDYNTSACCCLRPQSSDSAVYRRPTAKEYLNYTGGGETLPVPDKYNFRVCLSPESSKSEFLFLKACNPTLPLGDVNVGDTSNYQ